MLQKIISEEAIYITRCYNIYFSIQTINFRRQLGTFILLTHILANMMLHIRTYNDNAENNNCVFYHCHQN